MEKAFLHAQLSLSIPSMSSTYISALMYEAGVFAGFEYRNTRSNMKTRSGGPFETLQSTFSLITIIVEVITQIYLLLSTISSSSTTWNASSFILLSLSLAPTILRLAGSWMIGAGRNSRGRGGGRSWRLKRQEEWDIRRLGKQGEYKQEMVLFGLKNWVMGKWEGVKLEQMREQEDAKQNVGYIELGLGLGQHSIETAFYVRFLFILIPLQIKY
jgi:hypothetical protein